MTNNILLCEDYKPNYKNKANGLHLLEVIKNQSIKTAFFDPQYRGVLDKLSYGNEGKGRGKARSDLNQMSEETIKDFICEIDRVLIPSGHLFLWVDKFHLCQGVTEWLKDTNMNIVDMIVWDKGKIGMGYRTRRKSEYLVVCQKQPIKAKGYWTLHNIPDVWTEKVVKNHPHSKPIELQKQLILSTTQEGDWVLDPASGGYSVFSACQATNRNFIGCDIEFGDNDNFQVQAE
jgi:site-specific DNA-methyltransferase (adenine-specific)